VSDIGIVRANKQKIMRRRRFISPLTIRIMLVNIFALIFLGVGVLYVDQVQETSISTLKYNLDETQTIVKYIGDMPSTISSLSEKTLHTHEEIIPIVESSEWREEPNDP